MEVCLSASITLLTPMDCGGGRGVIFDFIPLNSILLQNELYDLRSQKQCAAFLLCSSAGFWVKYYRNEIIDLTVGCPCLRCSNWKLTDSISEMRSSPAGGGPSCHHSAHQGGRAQVLQDDADGPPDGVKGRSAVQAEDYSWFLSLVWWSGEWWFWSKTMLDVGV